MWLPDPAMCRYKSICEGTQLPSAKDFTGSRFVMSQRLRQVVRFSNIGRHAAPMIAPLRALSCAGLVLLLISP